MLWVVLQTLDKLCDWVAVEADLVDSREKRKPEDTKQLFKNTSAFLQKLTM